MPLFSLGSTVGFTVDLEDVEDVDVEDEIAEEIAEEMVEEIAEESGEEEMSVPVGRAVPVDVAVAAVPVVVSDIAIVYLEKRFEIRQATVCRQR